VHEKDSFCTGSAVNQLGSFSEHHFTLAHADHVTHSALAEAVILLSTDAYCNKNAEHQALAGAGAIVGGPNGLVISVYVHQFNYKGHRFN